MYLLMRQDRLVQEWPVADLMLLPCKQGWIHMMHNFHVQVAGETEVKANIKLRFRTIQGAPVVVSRSFQVCRMCDAC